MNDALTQSTSAGDWEIPLPAPRPSFPTAIATALTGVALAAAAVVGLGLDDKAGSSAPSPVAAASERPIATVGQAGGSLIYYLVGTPEEAAQAESLQLQAALEEQASGGVAAAGRRDVQVRVIGGDEQDLQVRQEINDAHESRTAEGGSVYVYDLRK